MRVRYLSGNQAGQVVDMGPEAAIMISNHLVEPVADDPAPVAAAEPEPATDSAIADLADEGDPVVEEPRQEGRPGRVRKPRKANVTRATSRRKRR